MIIKVKYYKGTLKDKWRIAQCQGERDYFAEDKQLWDCDKCRGRSYCYGIRVRPFFIKVKSEILVFAETTENAEEYAVKGHGWIWGDKSLIEGGFPIKLKREGDKISWDYDI